MSFKDDLMNDLDETFFNPDDFGEEVTLTRGRDSVVMRGLFDTPGLSEESVGEVSVIAHEPRLFVRSSDLPDSKMTQLPSSAMNCRITKPIPII